MIGYRISEAELNARVEAAVPGWTARARTRTARFIEAGRYDEASSIWSEIKGVYMTLQGESKCAYCERKLESQEYGMGEQDVEHFRPKARVRAWPAPQSLAALGVLPTEPPDNAPGYHALAYHVLNYAAACKPCNSVLKRDYFPIAGAYVFDGEHPKSLLDEKPLLIYPLGDVDVSPESLIGFIGVSPCALPKRGHARKRALTTIEFFKLDNVNDRKNLVRERAMVIVALFPQLESIRTTGGTPAAQALVAGYTSSRSPHASCARSFKALYERDPDEARAVSDLCAAFIETTS